MKAVLVNLANNQEEASWMYVNLERLQIIETDGENIEFEFPIDDEEASEGTEPGSANLIVNFGGVNEWQEYLESLPEAIYQPHPQSDWKNWCCALEDGSITCDEMYW
jgi:hypothetical protein